jgi:hypothetical protein
MFMFFMLQVSVLDVKKYAEANIKNNDICKYK